MKPTAFYIPLLAFFYFFACTEPASNGTGTGDPTGMETTTDSAQNTADTARLQDTSGGSRNLQDCPVKGKTFEKNILRMDDLAQLLSVQADETTYDDDLGDSHRVLEALNTTDCSEILRQTLPVNRSADFPYYLAASTYEPNNKIVAIQGFENFYFYDAENRKLSAPLVPDFMGEVEAVDAQSGMIRGLTIWRHYLMGHAIDFGPFAFDIQDKSKPVPVLPVAKYNIRNTSEYRYLFFLDGGNKRVQAIIPNTDIDAGGNAFKLQTLFPQALDIDQNIPKNVRNNRFIVLLDKTDGQGKRIAIDMFGQQMVNLPADIASKKTSEILDWLKKQ